jgi:FdrA protein
LLGVEPPASYNHIYYVSTMEEAALTAVKLADIMPSPFLEAKPAWDAAQACIGRLSDEQKYARGVFMGGTFAIEACLILSQSLGTVYTNTSAGNTLLDPFHSTAHTCVDMGSDLFTAGRPHPMLEPGIRNRRIIEELTDPETAVVLLDLVLGYGVHEDPATELVNALKEARRPRQSGDVPVVASVCGTDKDPQERRQQVSILQDTGILVFPSNRMASQAAAYICARGQTDMQRR